MNKNIRKKLLTFALACSMFTQAPATVLVANVRSDKFLTDANGVERSEIGKMVSANHEIIDVKCKDDQKHKLSLYLLDEDNSGRWSIVDIIDPLTQKILDSQNVYDFGEGVYLNYEISGHVQVRLTNVWKSNYKQSKDTSIHGIFIDDVESEESTVAEVTTTVEAATSAQAFNVVGKIFTENPSQSIDKQVPSIEIRFDGNIDPSTENLGNMKVEKNGQEVPGEWRTSFYSATFVPAEYLKEGTYTVDVSSSVKNIEGEAIKGRNFEFTVEPTIEVVYVNKDSIESETPRVDVAYNDRLEQSTTNNKAKLYFKNLDGTYKEIKTSKKGNNGGLMLEINEAIIPSGTYKLEIQPGIKSISGATSNVYEEEFEFVSKELSAKINAPRSIETGKSIPVTIEKCKGYNQVRFALSEEELAVSPYQQVQEKIEVTLSENFKGEGVFYAQFKGIDEEENTVESDVLNKGIFVGDITWGEFVPFDMSSVFDKDGFATHENYKDGVFDLSTETWGNNTANLCSDTFSNLNDLAKTGQITHEIETGTVVYQLSPNIYIEGQKNMATNNGRSFTVPQATYSELYILALGKYDDNSAQYKLHYTDGTNEVRKIVTKYWEKPNSGIYQIKTKAHAGWWQENGRPVDGFDAYINELIIPANPEKVLEKITIESSSQLMRTLAITGREAPTYSTNIPATFIQTTGPALTLIQTTGPAITVKPDDKVEVEDQLEKDELDMETILDLYGKEPEILEALDNTEITNVEEVQPGQPVPDPELLEEAENNPTGTYGQTLYPYARQVEKIMSYKVRMQAYADYELDFEDTLEAIRRVDNVTRGLEKKCYLVGWQTNGHDTGFPQFDTVNPRHAREGETSLESLKWLIKEAKERYNTTVVLHVNFSDAYIDDGELGPYMVKNNIISRKADGSLHQGWPWSGHLAYMVSSWANWFTGSFKTNQMEPLLNMLPELEGQSIHPDAWYTNNNSYYGKNQADTADAKRRMVKYMRDTYNMDITTEFEAGFDRYTTDDFTHYIPMIWQYGWNGDILDPMKVPAYIQTGVNYDTREGALTKSAKYFGSGLSIEPNLWRGIEAPITLPDVRAEFAQQELTHQFFNGMLRHSMEDDAKPQDGFDKVDTNSKGGEAVLFNSAGQRVVSKWDGDNSKTIKRTVTIDDDVIVQEPGNVFMPMAWRANREIQAWSEKGYIDRSWKLPAEWADVEQVDVYDLSEEGLRYLDSLTVSDSNIMITLTEDQSVVIVPEGQDPNSVEQFVPQGAVEFLERDTKTHGNWTTKYGRAGYDIFDSETENNLPESVEISYINSKFEKVTTGTSSYQVTVDSNMTGGTVITNKATANRGETVTVTVVPDEGMTLVDGSLKYNDVAVEGNTFKMPASDVIVTAQFKAIPASSYKVIVDLNIRGGKVVADKTTAEQGEIVTLTVTPDEGKRLVKDSLKYNGVAVVDSSFKMPAANVSITAQFEKIPSSNDSDDSTSTSGTSSPSEKPQADITVKPGIDANGNGSASITDKQIEDVIKNSKVTTVTVVFDVPANTNRIEAKLSQKAVASIVNNNKPLVIKSDWGSLVIEKEALEQVTDREFTVQIEKSAKMNGMFKVSISYAISGEIENIILYSKKGTGKEIVPNTCIRDGQLVFLTKELSGFEVVSNAKVFKDIKGHWAEKSIRFVTARELFLGVTDDSFGPDETMTRGMLVTILGRLYGADASEQTTSFTDVSADKYYAPYIKWAEENNIVKGVGDNKFAPDKEVTREEIAMIISNYADLAKINLVEMNDGAQLVDESDISSWALSAVTTMQKVGIMTGKGNGQFVPKANVTRAEVARVIEKLVEVTMK